MNFQTDTIATATLFSLTFTAIRRCMVLVAPLHNTSVSQEDVARRHHAS